MLPHTTKSSVSACRQRAVRSAALAVAAALLALASPVRAGARQPPKDPPATSRDAHDQLRNTRTGQYAKDPRVEADDGPDGLRRKFSKLLACQEGQDAHHIIPLSLRAVPVVAEATNAGWDLHGQGNGICLPEKIHGHGHRKYTDELRAELGSPSLNKLSKSAKVKAVERIVERLRSSLRLRKRPLE